MKIPSPRSKPARHPRRPDLARIRLTRPPSPNPAQLSASERYRHAEASRRVHLLTAYNRLLAQGMPRNLAARKLGLGRATLWRWTAQSSRRGYFGLLPATDRCGRKPKHPRRPLPTPRSQPAATLQIIVRLGQKVLSTRKVTVPPALGVGGEADAVNSRPAVQTGLKSNAVRRSKPSRKNRNHPKN